MDILSKSGDCLFPRPPLGLHYRSISNHASLTASSVGPVHLGSAPDTASHRDILAQIALAPAPVSTASGVRPSPADLRYLGLAWLLTLGLLVGQTGCGPAASGDPVTERNSPDAVPVPSSQTAGPGDTPVGLMWMATELDSQDDGTRRRALDPGALDPLVLAYKEKDKQVLARAMELIDQEDEAGEEEGKPGEE
ncbi:MAG: hypothetical protein L0H94_06065 [Nitrospira sp.]|nr:hypothetical protein [Nitrospira sp.]